MGGSTLLGSSALSLLFFVLDLLLFLGESGRESCCNMGCWLLMVDTLLDLLIWNVAVLFKAILCSL